MERSEQTQIRLDKIIKLKELGIDPYPPRPETVGKIEFKTRDLLDNFEKLSEKEEEVSTAGRIIAVRKHGKSVFMHIQDRTGKLQLFFRLNVLGEEKFNLIDYLDIGDYVGVRGVLFTTRTGENTLDVRKWDLLAKSLHPLPEKWHGLKDIELRIRKRYLDLLVNSEVKDIFIARARIIQAIRDFLNQRDFLEVETPILQSLYGGAFATPFTTHHEALDMDLFLRIADELYLKRLIIGDLERVYEISKNFRNEGIDRTHNPEFTGLELYQAYTDYNGMMELTEELVNSIAQELFGGEDITYNEQKLSLKIPFCKVKMMDAIHDYTGINMKETNLEQLKKYCLENEIELPLRASIWKYMEKIFDEKVQPNLIQPTFVLDYPIELSPLAKSREDDPELVERFELFMGGLEIANAFSELNDPLEQRRRFERQMEYRQEGEEEIQRLDEDFLLAIEHGMPPTGGLGIGIDRLVMLFTDTQSIREVILFPLTRAK